MTGSTIGGSAKNAFYFDNIVVTFNDVPEPSTLLYTVLGGLVLGPLRRTTWPRGRDTDPIP